MAREWYFVRRIRERERPHSGERFEIQILGDDGRAIGVGYVDAAAIELVVDGHRVPLAVIEAAKQRREGDGEYLGPDGCSIPPF
jgi:hypothetical protein